MPRIDTIFVTNKNDFFHSDAFDGQEFAFPPGEKVAVPVDAAVHMLGFGIPDKTDTLVRLGWASRFDNDMKRMVEDPAGVRKLANFIFTRAVMVEEPVTAPDGEPEIA